MLTAVAVFAGCEPVRPPPTTPPAPSAFSMKSVVPRTIAAKAGGAEASATTQPVATEDGVCCLTTPPRAQIFMRSTVISQLPARKPMSTTAPSTRPTGQPQKMLSAALREARPETVILGREVTVELISRSPEGLRRELIQCDSTLTLINQADDRMLREGDELVLPCRADVPAGLERPPAVAAGVE